MSSDDAALVRLLARSSRAELRGLRRDGVLAEGVAGVDDSLSISDLYAHKYTLPVRCYTITFRIVLYITLNACRMTVCCCTELQLL